MSSADLAIVDRLLREAAVSPNETHIKQLKTTALPLLRQLLDVETNDACQQSLTVIIDVVELTLELNARKTSNSEREKDNGTQILSR
uniref:Uncharacterized protein n=1 Tax=Plectus sambesii TaxID=2011161 RepID=A0A914WXX2_9BILA